jgi:1-acyl-sn-glycerol-3-phosphate acyltransferase
MKILANSIISYLKLISAGIYLFITGALCGIDPKNELKYRKRCSKYIISLITDKIEIEGEPHKDANLLIGNHTHNLDIPLMEAVIQEKIIWVTKVEMKKVPVIKYMVTKTDMVFVDRKDKRSVLSLIKDIRERTSRGLKVALFPEATRNKTNPKKMLPWKKGPKAIADKLNLKVQPFVIINLPFVFKNNPFRVEKKPIKVIFLSTYTPKENPNWYEDARNEMQKVIDREYAKLEKKD